MSRSKNKVYYFNTDTSESVWEKPENVEITPLAEVPGGGKIRASHILVKHSDSRNPSNWKGESITRSKEEAIEMIEGGNG